VFSVSFLGHMPHQPEIEWASDRFPSLNGPDFGLIMKLGQTEWPHFHSCYSQEKIRRVSVVDRCGFLGQCGSNSVEGPNGEAGKYLRG
jgi:hypothetical protein